MRDIWKRSWTSPLLILLLGSMGSSLSQAQCISSTGFKDGFEAHPSPTTLSTLPGLGALPVSNLTLIATPPLQLAGDLAPTLTAVQNGDWQDPVTWGGRLPATTDIVTIPRARSIMLSGNTPPLQGLHIDGSLQASGSDFSLRSRWIVVSGRFQAGTETQPFTARGLIELHGTDGTQNVLSMGTKNIAVTHGGVLKLHGECRLAWSKLSTDAPVGATQLQLADSAASWRAGDRLVLVSSSYDPRQAEVITVTAVNGNQVSFLPALQYRHVGLIQNYDGKVLDQRASVGLLSRNLKVIGAADSEANQFGGHIMSMAGAHMQISGVELEKLGQAGRLGRYPIHWHQAGDRSGNYLIATSIHNSFQRAAVLHSTHNVWFDSNVAYNIVNHAFVWSEDGDEYGNRLTRNLGILVRSPQPALFAFPINNPFHGNTSQDEHRSSVFWGRSYDRMTLTDNISAGVLDGFGYFFDLFSPAPFGQDEGSTLVFRNNIAHSTFKSFATGNQINYPEATTGHALMVSTGSSGARDHVFESYTGFYNTSGAWLEDRRMTLRNSIVADNGVGILLLRAQLDGVTVVGDSANTLPVQPFSPSVSSQVSAAIQVAGSNHGGKRAPIIRNSTIINQAGVGLLYDLDNVSPAAEVSNLSFINTPRKFLVHHAINFEFPDPPSYGLTDSTGSLFGDNPGPGNRALRYDSPLIDSRCTEFTDTTTYRCAQADSLMIDSSQSLNLADDQGQLVFVRKFDYFDDGMPDYGAVSYVTNHGIYEVGTSAQSSYRLRLRDAMNKGLELVFASTAAPSLVQQDSIPIASAVSLAALRASSISGYFYDAAERNLHVRLRSSTAESSLRVDAGFVARGVRGRAAMMLPAGAVDGFRHQAHAANAIYRLRQPIATNTPVRSGVSSSPVLNFEMSSPILAPSVSGDSVSFSGFVFAPSDGIYRFGLWGDGGGTAVWVGDTWVMGEPWAFVNSNWINNGQLTTEVVAFQVNGQIALRAGWHPVTVVHAKHPQHTGGRTLALRWATPSVPDTWVYPNLKRSP